MPTKEELRISFENSMELEKACKKLDERLPGVVCDKRGNLLFVNDRAKQRGFKSHEQSLFDVIYSDFQDIVAITLLESVSKAIELEEYGEYIIIFPASLNLRCVIWLDLSVRKASDLYSLLRDSVQYTEFLARVFSNNVREAEKPRRIIKERMEKVMQLLELSENPKETYGNLTYDLTLLTKMFCEYANSIVSQDGGFVEFSAPPAVLSKFNPELYRMLFCASLSLVMCKCENSSMYVNIECDDSKEKICKIRFKCLSYSPGAELFLNFLECTCFKLGMDCSVIYDKSAGFTEFTLVVMTEDDFDGFVRTSTMEQEFYKLSNHISSLFGRIYSHI